MMKLKKGIAILLALAMSLSLAACGSSQDETDDTADAAESSDSTVVLSEESVEKTNLVYGVDSEPTTLDPAEATDPSAYALFRAVYEPLWYFDTQGNIVYRLATSYEYDETETIMTISLREGVTFHNGDAFTADDVIYTLEYLSTSATHSGDVAVIDLENTKALDDYTVELHLTRVAANMVYSFAQPYWAIRDREFSEANPDNFVTTVANGTGPYELEAWNVGEEFSLSRNENYWGTPANYETVSIKFISDEFTRMMEFEAGNLDVCLVTTSSNIDDLNNGVYSDASLVQMSSGSVWSVEINVITEQWAEIYNNLDLRKALFHSIDVDAILANITGSSCAKATSILPSNCWAYVDVGGYDYDVEYAKECLAAAGYEPGELTISIVYQPSAFVAEIWEAIQAYWKEIGVTLEIEPAEFSVWGPGMINGEFPMALEGAQNCLDPSDAFTPRKADNGNLPMTWPTEELTALDEAAESTSDLTERQDYYTQIQQIMHDEYWALPLYEATTCWAVQDYISGWGESCDALCVPILSLVG